METVQTKKRCTCTHLFPPGDVSIMRECKGHWMLRGGRCPFLLGYQGRHLREGDVRVFKEEEGFLGLGRKAFQPEGLE